MKACIVGSKGKMGKELVKAVIKSPQFTLHSCVVRSGSDDVGRDSGELVGIAATGIKVSDRIAAGPDVVIDFSTRDALLDNATICAQNKIPYITGITGIGAKELDVLKRLASGSLVFYAPNMSIQVWVLARLAEDAARMLDGSFDIEIVEMHHNQKADAPSGTALMLGRAAAAGRGVDFEKTKVFNRTGKRNTGDIGFSAIRGGDVVGEHKVIFAGVGERIELVHIDTKRSVFAYGALKAARWLVRQQPGKLYGMKDLLMAAV